MDKNAGGDSDEPVSKSAIVAMIAIVAGLTLVSLYANWQQARRDQIESVKITPFTPTPSPAASPAR